MNKENFEAVCIMFAELKEKIESLSRTISAKNQDDSVLEIRKILEGIQIPSENNTDVESLKQSIQSDFRKAFEHLAALVQQKEEDKVVSHIHSIHIKSVKVCIAFSVLYILLMISVYFNFR